MRFCGLINPQNGFIKPIMISFFPPCDQVIASDVLPEKMFLPVHSDTQPINANETKRLDG